MDELPTTEGRLETMQGPEAPSRTQKQIEWLLIKNIALRARQPHNVRKPWVPQKPDKIHHKKAT